LRYVSEDWYVVVSFLQTHSNTELKCNSLTKKKRTVAYRVTAASHHARLQAAERATSWRAGAVRDTAAIAIATVVSLILV
jgi:hypothetical protein